MTKLPVFSTIGQALAVLGLYFGKILPWALIVLVIGVVPLDLAKHFMENSILAGGGPESPEAAFWALAYFAALLWLAVTLTPLVIKINQLAVFGRAQPAGYAQSLFSGRTLRFLGYTVIVGLISIAGVTLALTPLLTSLGVAVAGADVSAPDQVMAAIGQAVTHGGSMIIFGALVSTALVITFVALALPFQLVFPAVSVEEKPSLGRAYGVASGNKLRLLGCTLVIGVFFFVLNMGLARIWRAFGTDQNVGTQLIFLPLTHIVMFFEVATAKSVYAVAYRILSGLPDPRAAGYDREMNNWLDQREGRP